MTTPDHIANFFLSTSRERGEILTNLKLQKLLYYAQAWYLAINDTSLFEEDFQAWIHGPVLLSQYHRFSSYEWRPILEEDLPFTELIDVNIIKHLNEILEVFGVETAVSLELMTHREDPWLNARVNLAPTDISQEIISKESMKKFYRTLM